MACYQLRGNRVCVYTYTNGKQVAVPRQLTKHLDGQPVHNIEAWIANYELSIEGKTPQNLETTPALERLKEQYLEFLKTEKRTLSTVYQYQRALSKWILPFFLSNNLEDPTTWPLVSIKLREWIVAQSGSQDDIRWANTALRGFWKFHTEEGRIVSSLTLNLRPPKIQKQSTPLQKTVSPEELLAWENTCAQPQIKLMGLLGYFFSLRTQELFGMTKGDFRAGTAATELECCRVMQRNNLFCRFAVKVTRQRDKYGNLSTPKANSSGWVACYNEQAAQKIVGLLKGYEAGEPLFKFQNEWLMKLWSKNGVSGITLKDLRRASLYYLGHYTSMDYVSLKNHARHLDPTTTWLYLRRPDETVEEQTELDLDA